MAVTFEVTRREDNIEINGIDYFVEVNTVYRGKSSLIQFRIKISRDIPVRLDRKYSIQHLVSERVYKSHRKATYDKLAKRYEEYLQRLLGEDYSIIYEKIEDNV